MKNENLHINFMELFFTDLFGETKSVIMPLERKSHIVKNGTKCDGSSIKCCKQISNSDISLKVFDDYKFALNNAEVYIAETSHKYDARKNLRKLEDKYKKLGYTIFIGAELEFFLFDTFKGKVCNNFDNKNYYSLIENKALRVLTKVAEILKANGYIIEALHHECGINQYELDFKFDTALKTADRIIFAKRVIFETAKECGLHASFMPKPLNGVAGSGMHINISIFKDNKNLIYERNKSISEFGIKFINGIFNHIGAISAFANPRINSYKRLNSGFEAPNKVEYSCNNRSVLIRLPKAKEENARIELRSPDISCNPYLTICAVLTAGLENAFCEQIEQNKMPTTCLPKSLFESLEMLKNDALIFALVPKSYVEEKLKECTHYASYVTDWETKQDL